MTQSYQEEDTAMTCTPAAFCSGAGVNGDTDMARKALVGGSAGSTEVTVTVDSSAADLACAWFELDVSAGVSWDGGTWTVRLNVTTSNHQVALDAIYICRVNSSCTNQATIGSVTALADNLGSTGVRSHNVTGSAQSPSAGDKVIVVLLFDNMQAMPQDIGFTPSEIITSPFTPPGGEAGQIGATVGVMIVAGLHRIGRALKRVRARIWVPGQPFIRGGGFFRDRAPWRGV